MNDSAPLQRQPHAVLDTASRAWKAEKIARLLGLTGQNHPIRLLEIGTGSGGIAHWFAHHPSLRCDVVAVDVHDNRLVRNGYDFIKVDSTELPFENSSFDVVISNHVIEHVGGETAQAHHLSEIRRVMREQGVGYLAVPNRWMLIEPHYRLMFLSWLPRRWRTPYLRVWRKGDVYDCEPLQMRQLEGMLESAGFAYQNMCIEALTATLDIERPTAWTTMLIRSIPYGVLHSLRGAIPTLIYRMT